MEEDPFPDPSPIDPRDADQEADVKMDIKDIVTRASREGLADDHAQDLRHIVDSHSDMFRNPFSAGPPAHVPLL